MSKQELFAAAALLALVAYKLGMSKGAAKASAPIMNDPLAWLNGYQAV